MQRPLVFDIKRYSINDGPGIRVTIFFKGCPLNCQWCHNPESISPKTQKLFTVSKCIGCGECCRLCPLQACSMTPEGIATDRLRCTLCGKCAEACPSLATEMSGRLYSVDELLKIIERERPFFDQSDGGVTFSGGEPLLYPDFLTRLLIACGEGNIHRAVDTSGHVSTETLLNVARHVDLFLYDLKVIDAEKHRQHTGVDNKLILANLNVLAETGAAIQVRVPLIRGLNDDTESVRDIAGVVAGLPGRVVDVSLLPFHDIALGKDRKLGQSRDLSTFGEPSSIDIERAVTLFSEHGLNATIGG